MKRSIIRPYLENYTLRAILFYSPIRLLKAIFLFPLATTGLIVTTSKVFRLFSIGSYDYGLVHADIKASNILINKRTIYLTDWEQAGWGITTYNAVAPLCVHWQNQEVRDRILGSLRDKGFEKIIIPLLAYGILVLHNQNIDKKTMKQMRDLELLKFVETA